MSESRGEVAIVVPFLDHLGGTEALAWSLAERFAEERIQVRVFTCRHVRERGGVLPRAGPFLSIESMSVLQRPPLLDLTWVLPGARRLARRRPIAIIALHLPTAGVLAACAARKLGVPFFASSQGSDEAGDATALTQLPFRRWRVSRLNRADAIGAISEASASELRALGIDANLIRQVPSYVDRTRFARPSPSEREAARKTLGLAATAFAIACTGRLHPLKRIDVLIEAIVQMRDAVLLVTGDGPDRERLLELVERRGVGHAVKFLGRLSDHRVVLHAADIYALPSASEGISVALLEAMAVTLPVVVSDIPGNREVITDASMGLVVPLGDIGAWVAALSGLATDVQRRHAVAARGAARVAESFDRGRVEGLYVEWFRSLRAKP